jgi:hypothetical protein
MAWPSACSPRGRGRPDLLPASGQLVISALLNLAQAIEQKTTM